MGRNGCIALLEDVTDTAILPTIEEAPNLPPELIDEEGEEATLTTRPHNTHCALRAGDQLPPSAHKEGSRPPQPCCYLRPSSTSERIPYQRLESPKRQQRRSRASYNAGTKHHAEEVRLPWSPHRFPHYRTEICDPTLMHERGPKIRPQ